MNAATRVEVREDHSMFSYEVEVLRVTRCHRVRAPDIECIVAPSPVIGQQENEIGLRGDGSHAGQEQSKQRPNFELTIRERLSQHTPQPEKPSPGSSDGRPPDGPRGAPLPAQSAGVPDCHRSVGQGSRARDGGREGCVAALRRQVLGVVTQSQGGDGAARRVRGRADLHAVAHQQRLHRKVRQPEVQPVADRSRQRGRYRLLPHA